MNSYFQSRINLSYKIKRNRTGKRVRTQKRVTYLIVSAKLKQNKISLLEQMGKKSYMKKKYKATAK